MLVVLLVSLILIALMIGVFPLLLKLSPIEKIDYLELGEENFVNLNEELSKSFESIQLIKDEDGRIMSLLISPKENVKYADLTIALLDANKNVKIKGHRIKFKDYRNVEIKFNKEILKIGIYVNQVNHGLKKEHVLQKINPIMLESFIFLEWAGASGVAATALWDILTHSFVLELWMKYGDRSINLPMTIIFAILIGGLMYVVIRYVSYFYFGKYVYGGKFND